MTNVQFLLTTGIPSVLVVLGWLQTNSRLGRVEAGLDKVDSKVDSLRVDMNRDMVALRDSIHRDMILLHERVAVVEAKHS